MMATYYVWSGAAGSNNGSDWTNAYTAMSSALAVATTNGDAIKVHNAHDDAQATAVTYTLGADIAVICVDKDNSDALSTGAILGNGGATNIAVTVAGAFTGYFYGINFKNGTGTTGADITLGTTDGAAYTFDACTFTMNNNGNTEIIVGASTAAANAGHLFSNCTFSVANATQPPMVLHGNSWFGGCQWTGTVPPSLVETVSTTTKAVFEGCDLSNLTTALIADLATQGTARFEFINCRLGVSTATAIMADQTSVTNRGSAESWLFNCSSGDTHYAFFHKNAIGTTEVSATIYADDGAQYDGTNRCSWKITSSASANYWHPYISPWIDKYHSGTSAITMSLECLRDGSTTLYQNDEVWGEFSYQGTSGSTKSTLVNDRMALLGTPADQTSSSISWTGGTTPGKFKLESGSVTPAEIGHLRARVVVGEPSITVYVDPTIRTA